MEAVTTFTGLATVTLGSALLAVLLDWLCLRGLATANELALLQNRGGDRGGGKPCYS